jgi:hypothetical protein
VHSSWLVKGVRKFHDAITGGTSYDLGLYRTAGDGGAVGSFRRISKAKHTMSEYLDCLGKEAVAEGRRAFALERAVEMAPRGTTPARVVPAAEIFERYLRGKSARLEMIAKP